MNGIGRNEHGFAQAPDTLRPDAPRVSLGSRRRLRRDGAGHPAGRGRLLRRARPPRPESMVEPAIAAGARKRRISRQGQVVHRAVHVRRRQPGRHVRPQARPRQARRQADSRSSTDDPLLKVRNPGKLLASSRKFARHGQAGIDGFRPVSRTWPRVRRRHRGHPQHVRRQLRARLGPASDEHRLSAPGSIPAWARGSPTGWARSTRTCRATSCLLDQRGGPISGPAQLGLGLHAGDLPGNPVSDQRRSRS